MTKPRFSEYIHGVASRIDFFVNHWKHIRKLEEPATLVARGLALAIEDVKEYYCITTDDFFEYAIRWAEEEQRLFFESKDLKSFYESWTGQSAKFNVCANILNQLTDSTNTRVVAHLFSSNIGTENHILDFGCGTATLTISLAITSTMRSRVILADVENDIMEFVRFRIKKRKLNDRIVCTDVADSNRMNCDMLICIDVLEHLENASDTFIHRIHPQLGVGGIMYLRAPWRNQLTHLGTAADDFYLNGGRKLLGRKYKVLRRVVPMDVACLYKKMLA